MTNPYTEARNNAAGMPGHSMSADVGVREALFDRCPAVGASTAEPSIRELVRAYYRRAFSAGIAERHTSDYLAALNAPTESVKALEGVTILDTDNARLALWKAIEAVKIGNKTDDKLIIANLAKQGVYLASASGKPTPDAPLIVVTDDKGFITLHEPNEDGDPGDIVASVWRDDWLSRLSPTPITADDAVAKERERLREALEAIANLRIANDFRFPSCGPTVAAFARAAILSLSPDTEGEGM